LVLAQRTADEVKASAHKEADLIREQARMAAEREITSYNDAIGDVRREHQRTIEASEKAKSELRNLLTTHLSLLEGTHNALQQQQLSQQSAAVGEPPSTDTTRIEVF
jgi:cell division septum initiation protein DivIVA